MGIRGGAWLAGLLVTASLGVSCAFSAAAEAFVFPATRNFSATLHGTHGYTVTFEASGDEDKVTASVSTRSSNSAYSVKGRVDASGFEGRIGGLGTVAVSFEPSAEAATEFPPDKGCSGGAITITEGTFSGELKFRGEGGYTEVDATGARGVEFTSTRGVCPGFRRGPHAPPPRGASAGVISGCRGLSFSAIRTRPLPKGMLARPRAFGPVEFTALDFEHRGPLSISRVALAHGKLDSLLFAPGLAGASVRPPAPFTGAASFDAASGGWTGNLRVAFPGREVALTGGENGAKLVHVKLEKEGYGYSTHGGTCRKPG